MTTSSEKSRGFEAGALSEEVARMRIQRAWEQLSQEQFQQAWNELQAVPSYVEEQASLFAQERQLHGSRK